MAKIREEKRAYPRIKTKLKLNISKNIRGETVNLSEEGLQFNSSDVISSPKISVRACFSEINLEFKAKARFVWRRDLQDGSSLYGVEFVRLTKAQKAMLRKKLIEAQISGLLNEITSPELRLQIANFFLKDLLNYVNGIEKLIEHVSRKKEYSLEFEKNLDHLNILISLKGYCLEELLSHIPIMKKVKKNFRQLIGTWVYKSIIVKRAFEKPKGYPGDYKMLEIIYDNKPLSKNIGLYFDNYFLKNPYAAAVRNRKDHFKTILQNFINKAESERIHILNFSSGSCREIREILPNLKTRSSIVFTCIDWDEEALEFSLNSVANTAHPHIKMRCVREDLIKILKNGALLESYGKHDLIYSMCLMDYLPDRALKKLIVSLYHLLKEGGKLIVSHQNREKTLPPVTPDWFCNWKFVPRDKDEVAKLFYTCGIPRFSLSTKSDEFSYIYYFTLTRLQAQST